MINYLIALAEYIQFRTLFLNASNIAVKIKNFIYFIVKILYKLNLQKIEIKLLRVKGSCQLHSVRDLPAVSLHSYP